MPTYPWKDQMFTHDCDRCIFLGHWEDPEMLDGYQHFDFYACPARPGMTTSIIARYSNEGSDYVSIPYHLVIHDRVLLIAKSRYDEYISEQISGDSKP